MPLSQLPKIELHLHLEGAIRLDTLRLLSQAKGVALPAHLEKGDAIYFSTFAEFVETFTAVVRLLETEEDFRYAIRDVMRYVREHFVLHCEVSWTPFPYLQRGLDIERILHIFNEELEREGMRQRIYFILDSQRDHGEQAARQVFDLALQASDLNVVGIGLTGDETRFSTKDFAPFFHRAAERGLGRTAHAGEYGSPQAIWEAIEQLGATRIGHGIQAIYDERLMQYILEKGVHLEVSPTSNLLLCRVDSYEEHPIHSFLEAGLSLGINSDDPAIFATHISREYALLLEYPWWNLETIRQTLRHSAQAAFLSEGKRGELIRMVGL